MILVVILSEVLPHLHGLGTAPSHMQLVNVLENFHKRLKVWCRELDRNIIRAVVRSAILYRLWSKNAKVGCSETISRHIYKGGICNPVSLYHQSMAINTLCKILISSRLLKFQVKLIELFMK